MPFSASNSSARPGSPSPDSSAMTPIPRITTSPVTSTRVSTMLIRTDSRMPQ